MDILLMFLIMPLVWLLENWQTILIVVAVTAVAIVMLVASTGKQQKEDQLEKKVNDLSYELDRIKDRLQDIEKRLHR